MDERGSPAPILGVIEGVGDHQGVLCEDGVNGLPELAGAFAVDDSDSQDALVRTGLKVIRNEVLDLPRTEGVQIEDAVDGDLDGA